MLRLGLHVRDALLSGNQVALVYDGDPDVRDRPDVGSIFGRMADLFNRHQPRIVLLAAQTEGWYGEPDDGPIGSDAGVSYETYVFDDALPGAHSALTQSQQLVNYAGYEQVYVGPVGSIARDQLADVNRKSLARPRGLGPVQVAVVRARINTELDQLFAAQLAAMSDEQARSKVEAKIRARALRPYGYFCTADGDWALDPSDYPGLYLHFVEATPVRSPV